MDEMNNLDNAVWMVQRIAACQQVQTELKRAFKDDELDGGWKTALEHPLYLDAQREIDALREQMKLLI